MKNLYSIELDLTDRQLKSSELRRQLTAKLFKVLRDRIARELRSDKKTRTIEQYKSLELAAKLMAELQTSSVMNRPIDEVRAELYAEKSGR